MTLRQLNSISLILLIVGLALTFMSSKLIEHLLCLNIISMVMYIASFFILFLTQKYRVFVINPSSLIYTTPRQYKITPWLIETETRWPSKLFSIKIRTSRSIAIESISIMNINIDIKKCFKEKCLFKEQYGISMKVLCNDEPAGKSVVISFSEPLIIDVNTIITISISRDESIEEEKPFIEYTIDYKVSWSLIRFRTSRRIF